MGVCFAYLGYSLLILQVVFVFSWIFFLSIGVFCMNAVSVTLEVEKISYLLCLFK